MELLAQKRNILFSFIKNCKQFSKVVAPFYSPMSNVEEIDLRRGPGEINKRFPGDVAKNHILRNEDIDHYKLGILILLA